MNSNTSSITVIGCGRWGSAIAYYLDTIGESVVLYEPGESQTMQAWQRSRHGEILDLPESVELQTDLARALESGTIVISIRSQNLRQLAEEIATYSVKDKKIVLCMKGLEVETGKRLSEVAEETLGSTNSISVWAGPGHAQDLFRGVPTCMVIDGKNSAVTKELVDRFSSKLIRLYYGKDLIGTEIGAATKNIIGIGAGLLDGVGMTSLKGALTARGTFEVSRLIEALGGNPLTAYSLAHLGDYGATIFSKYSHNRAYGEAFARGEEFEKLAEGYYTAKAIVQLANEKGLNLPIMTAIYSVIHEKHNLHDEIDILLSSPLSGEFE